MDVYLDSELLRVCKTCGVGVLSASEPERFKNCAACRAQKRETKVSRKTSTSSLATTGTRSNGKQKTAKALQKLEGSAKQAKTKMKLQNGHGGSSEEVRKQVSGSPAKRGSKVRVFESPGHLYEELRSDAMDAHDKRCLLEFNGCFDWMGQAKTIDNKEHVRNVTGELVKIHLLLNEFVSQARSYSQVDGSSYSTVYPCSCQPRDECYGQIKVTAATTKVYDNGVACQKTSIRVYHN